MYVRVYDNSLIKVYEKEDLKSSEIIGELKGREVAGFTQRDSNNKIIFHDTQRVTSEELQIIIRNIETVTVAIKMNSEEISDYFYSIAKVQLIENNCYLFSEKKLDKWMRLVIDAGIVKSVVWSSYKKEVYGRLLQSGFKLKSLKYRKVKKYKTKKG